MSLGTVKAINLRIELGADDPAAVRAGLLAAVSALDHGVEPNTLWGKDWYLAIVPGGPV